MHKHTIKATFLSVRFRRNICGAAVLMSGAARPRMRAGWPRSCIVVGMSRDEMKLVVLCELQKVFSSNCCPGGVRRGVASESAWARRQPSEVVAATSARRTLFLVAA